jgi:hypothetical protein
MGGSLPVRVRLDPQATWWDAFEDTAVGVRIDVLRNGTIARQLDTWWLAGSGVDDRQYAWEVPFWDNEVLAAPDAEGDRWTVRVRGAPELAMRVRGAKRWWSGDLDIEVALERRGGEAPPRGWRRERPRLR